jgi:tRNA1(Val) A37 N6-methylase TrmN6
LLLARALPDAAVVGVEAVPESHALAVRNARLNGLEARFEPRLGDLRAHGTWANAAPYDLVTGAPPFMPLGTGPLPADPQRAAGRFELRGGVEAYADTAARALAPDGLVVLLMDGRGLERTLRALQAVNLEARAHVEVRPRPALPPTYQVVVAAAGPANSAPLTERLPMRGDVGEAWSPEYQTLRLLLDL